MASGKPAPTQYEITPVIANRWSGRAIDPDTPVAREHLLQMLEAARWAPSCYGAEPWRFLVWDRNRNPQGWERACECLAQGNQAWARNAPVLMVAVADSRFAHNDKPNRWGEYDTGAASVSLHIQGVELGLVVHQMGGFSKDQLAEAFDIPERYTPMAMIAVGHPGDPGSLSDDQRKNELGERRRRPLGEIAFEGSWENPLTAD